MSAARVRGFVSELCGPFEDDFMRGFPGRPFVHHGSPLRLERLYAIPELADVRAVVEATRNPVKASFADDALYGDDAGLVDARASLARYEAGALLQFTDVHQSIPALASLTALLDDELGLPVGATRAQVFASSRGNGATPHSDNDPVLTVQLRGRKNWRFAASPWVEEPLAVYTCGGPTTALEGYVDGDGPTDLPGDATLVEMEAGSVLYIPRGCLHTTTSIEDSLSIGFDFIMPCKADLVCAALRRLLVRDATWRAYALPPAVSPLDDRMISELASAVSHIAANQDLVVKESGLRLFTRFGGTLERKWEDVQVVRADGEPNIVVTSQMAATRLELSPEFGEVIHYLASTNGPIRERELERHAASIERNDVVELLRQLVEVGMLVRSTLG